MKLFTRKWHVLALVLALTGGALIIGFLALGAGQAAPATKIRVLYLGKEGPVSRALALDTDTLALTVGTVDEVSAAGLEKYDAVVLDDMLLTAAQDSALRAWALVQADGQYKHGVLVVMGRVLTRGSTTLAALGFTAETSFQNNTDDIKGLSVANATEASTAHSVVSSITWNAFPEIVNYTLLAGFEAVPGNMELITMQYQNGTESPNSLVVARNVAGDTTKNPNVVVYAYWLQDLHNDPEHNAQFILCPYFNYLVFGTVVGSTSAPVISFGSWQYSPVPHLAEQVILGGLVATCAVVAVVLFKRARKRGKARAAPLEGVAKISDTAAGEATLSAPEDGIQSGHYPPGAESVQSNPWEEIGYHRQVSGFIKMFFLVMFMVLPQLIVTSILMPRFLNPYPQASGWYSLTFHFFEGIWLMFDMGMSFTFAKFFSQHRIERPEKAYHYVQIFVWWQILSGCGQIFVVAFVGSIILPGTTLAYVSWMFVAHSLVQFPGIFLIFQYFFQGMQKADYQMISYVLREFLLRLACQALLVPICREIYAGQVMYGAAFGAGIGLVLGYQLGETLLFLTTMKLYKGLGLKTAPVFAAQFTKDELKETVKFGFKIAVGEALPPLVWLLQVLLVATYLPNASAEQGYFELAWTIGQLAMVVTLLTSSMVGALTEAHTYKKASLLNYVSGQGWRWGLIWTLFMTSSLWAIGRTFVLGASGELWGRAADILPWLLLFHLLGPISWQGDQEFTSANRPGLAGLSWIIEQSVRATLLLVFLPMFKFMETVVWTYVIALAIKDTYVWTTIRRKIHKWDWNVWPTFVAPALAGLCNFAILSLVVTLLGTSIIDALLLFFISFFGMAFVYSFFIGLFGGYDNNTLAELDKATKMVTGVRKLARLYYHMAATGAKISPLHNRFPVKVYAEAAKEAAELTKIKKSLQVVG